MNNKNGTVYFILDTSANLVKIGFTRNLKRRMKQLETSNCNLKIIYKIENCSMDYEQSLHIFFQTERVKNEWFNYGDSIKQWIKRDKIKKEYFKKVKNVM
ncbi:GIY-YIG nuclease family protein [Clostridium botulinum]|uniref:GIY-YIG nuclease family protein n=1 Tax=Clostridium botulinum TaxID=1491 RepID=UPI001375678D|nr:GIY-YIG nuclease family protein [Clostridium botulinum]NCI19843.1 GIY-YIG nuclease family protein [Clostridium botulinum]NCI35881.1 GIY-YIG nuclease family protein [Clostridium botulinum]NCI71738.1 GIY-YIG nuclease family protein [Clostridium botulinum]NDI38654.1 GIY-YIG nuclease family protein [Clostridium botulinum]